MDRKIRIGTRGSRLALYQAERVKEAIEQFDTSCRVEIIVIKTKGDKILDVALSKIGDKGLFTKEIENAMLRDEVDMAVHSLKDLPTVLPEGLKLGGVLQRDEVRDVLVSRDHLTLDQLTEKHKIATSSLRRKAQLLKYNPKFTIIDIRGNVDTRLAKLDSGYCDAMIMAGTALLRLGLDDRITQYLDVDVMIPPPSQGIIGIEIREGDEDTQTLLDKITNTVAWQLGQIERTFLNTLEGGCQIPIACYSQLEGEQFIFTGYISDPLGRVVLVKKQSGCLKEGIQIAESMAKELLKDGGEEILKDLRGAK